MEVSDISIAFGLLFSEIRKQYSISAFELALRSGLSRHYCSGLLHGNRNPSLFTIVMLAKAFNMSASELLDGLEDLI